MAVQVAFVPDGQYSNKDLEKFLFELERFSKGREVMTTKQAAAFLGISVSKVYQMPSLPSHKIEGLDTRLFLRSELVEFIKKS